MLQRVRRHGPELEWRQRANAATIVKRREIEQKGATGAEVYDELNNGFWLGIGTNHGSVVVDVGKCYPQENPILREENSSFTSNNTPANSITETP